MVASDAFGLFSEAIDSRRGLEVLSKSMFASLTLRTIRRGQAVNKVRDSPDLSVVREQPFRTLAIASSSKFVQDWFTCRLCGSSMQLSRYGVMVRARCHRCLAQYVVALRRRSAVLPRTAFVAGHERAQEGHATKRDGCRHDSEKRRNRPGENSDRRPERQIEGQLTPGRICVCLPRSLGVNGQLTQCHLSDLTTSLRHAKSGSSSRATVGESAAFAQTVFYLRTVSTMKRSRRRL